MSCLTQIDFLKHLKSFGHFTFARVASSFHSRSTFPSACADQSSCLCRGAIAFCLLCVSKRIEQAQDSLSLNKYWQDKGITAILGTRGSLRWEMVKTGEKKKSQCVFIWKKVNPFHSLIFFAFELALLFHLGFRVFKLREARNRDIFFVLVK